MPRKMKPIIVKDLGVQTLTFFELYFHIAKGRSASWEVVGDPNKTIPCASSH